MHQSTVSEAWQSRASSVWRTCSCYCQQNWHRECYRRPAFLGLLVIYAVRNSKKFLNCSPVLTARILPFLPEIMRLTLNRLDHSEGRSSYFICWMEILPRKNFGWAWSISSSAYTSVSRHLCDHTLRGLCVFFLRPLEYEINLSASGKLISNWCRRLRAICPPKFAWKV